LVKKDLDKNSEGDKLEEDEKMEEDGGKEYEEKQGDIKKDSDLDSDENDEFQYDKSKFELKTYFFEFGYLLHDSTIPKNVFAVK